MKLTKTPIAIAIIGALGIGSPIAYAVPETETNDTFAERNVLAPEVRLYEGELSPGVPADPFFVDNFFDVFAPDHLFSGTLTEGGVDSYGLTLNPNDNVAIIVDNRPGGFLESAPDTVLGVFDEAGTIVQTDDDSSPAGDGLADAIFDAFVQPSGNLDFKVSGYPDFNFDGNSDGNGVLHSESGDYEVGVFVNRSIVDEIVEGDGDFFFGEFGGGEGLVEGDVDFVTFTGLTAGDMFSVELFTEPYAPPSGSPESGLPGNGLPGPDGTFPGDPVPIEMMELSLTGGMIGLFDDSGTLLAADRGWDGQTMLGGIVPSSGNINIAITGVEDDGNFDDGEAFNGTSFFHGTGLYDVVLETFTLGAPGSPGDISDIVELPNAPFLCGGEVICFGFGDLPVEEGQIVNLDPDVAVGYAFDILSGSGFFETVMLPSVGADTEFQITVNGNTFTVQAGVLYDFALDFLSSDVSSFDVLGIDPNEGLDPTLTTAFVTQVTFSTTDIYDVTMTPYTEFVPDPNAVPEPASLALFGAGLAGLGFAARRRRKD